MSVPTHRSASAVEVSGCLPCVSGVEKAGSHRHRSNSAPASVFEAQCLQSRRRCLPHSCRPKNRPSALMPGFGRPSRPPGRSRFMGLSSVLWFIPADGGRPVISMDVSAVESSLARMPPIVVLTPPMPTISPPWMVSAITSLARPAVDVWPPLSELPSSDEQAIKLHAANVARNVFVTNVSVMVIH